MSLFTNKNQGDLQSTPTPASYADIPDDQLRPWWTQVRRSLTEQLYSIQNSGIFAHPILNNPVITGGTIVIDDSAAVRLAQSTFGVAGNDVGVELALYRTKDGYTYIDFHSAAPVTADYETRLVRTPGINGSFEIDQKGSGDLKLLVQTGKIQLGAAWAAITTESLNGFVQMKDASGTLRKFATVA